MHSQCARGGDADRRDLVVEGFDERGQRRFVGRHAHEHVPRAFAEVLEALPADAGVLLYHIPAVTGVPIGAEVLTALRAAFGPPVAGVKDSGAKLADTERLLAEFPELALFTGTDSHLGPALEAGAVGAITALASACGAELRTAYDLYVTSGIGAVPEGRLTALRAAAQP